MALSRCDKCGKEFGSEHALRIHIGRQHGAIRKAGASGRTVRRYGKTRRGAPIGRFVCGACGRTFRLAMHLARHATATHGLARGGRRPGRLAGRGAGLRSVSGRFDVRSLTVDRLLALKQAVDVRLADIVRQMRRAKVRV